MLRLILITVVITLRSNAASPLQSSNFLNQRIIGGNETTIRAYPFYAAILFRGVPVCGASFIKSSAVLTSASCISAFRPSMLQVQVGSAVPGDGEIVNVTRFCNHPLYSFTSPAADYDVSVVFMNRYISTTPAIQMVSLRSVNLDVPTGKLATVVGFGTVGYGGPRNKVLQALPLPRVRDIDCQRAYPSDEITDRMVCFGYPEGGKDACNAGGSPLVYGGVQVGIDSWSYGCGFPNTPRVFTRVYNEEIQNHIAKCS